VLSTDNSFLDFFKRLSSLDVSVYFRIKNTDMLVMPLAMVSYEVSVDVP
jgi:hypothetical protein